MVVSIPVFLPFLYIAEVGVQSFEALLPVPSVLTDPVGDVSQRSRPKPPRSPLRVPALLDESGALQHPEVLGDSGLTHLEGFRQLRDRGLALRKTGQDGPPSRVGESGERGAERVWLLHGLYLIGYITCRYYTAQSELVNTLSARGGHG
jgi:hypothetical protein